MCLRVAVIDYTHFLYPLLLKIKDIDVVLLYGPSDVGLDDIVKLGHNNINYFNNSGALISKWNKSFVSKEDIMKYRSTQLKVERYAQRHNMIPSYATSQYYHSLAFWEYYLCGKLIDCLIIVSSEHGTPIDSVPIDVAKSKDIPVFLFDTMYGNMNRYYMAIRCENTAKYVKLNEIDPCVSLVDINDVFFPSSNLNSYENHLLDILDTNSLISNANVKLLAYVVKKAIIFHSKMCMFFSSLIGQQGNIYKYYKKDISIVLMIYALLSSHNYNFRRHKQYAAAMELVEHPHKNLLQNIHYLSTLKRYYRKISKKYVDPNINGIVYALQFEPEASIMNRTVYNSQIYNIEMLSAVLPIGWKIFVKEHPNQFSHFDYDSSYAYKQIPIYRRKEYYDHLLEIPNVELVDDRLSSNDLLNSKKYPNIHAISTINGTIAAESICAGKPVILFGSESTVYDDITGVFKISDIDSLNDAIDNIVTKNISVDPQEIKKISEYLIAYFPNMYSGILMQISEKALLTLIKKAKTIAQISEN